VNFGRPALDHNNDCDCVNGDCVGAIALESSVTLTSKAVVFSFVEQAAKQRQRPERASEMQSGLGAKAWLRTSRGAV